MVTIAHRRSFETVGVEYAPCGANRIHHALGQFLREVEADAQRLLVHLL